MGEDVIARLRTWVACTEDDAAAMGAALRGRVIDVGCGPGSHVDPCSSIGLEALAPRAAVAVDRAFADSAFGLRVRADLDGRRMPFRDAAFDAALCTHVLEHVRHASALVAEIARVVKPGGFLFVAVPNGWSLSDNVYKAWKAVFLVLKGEPIPHVQRFTKAVIARLLARAGCQVVGTARIGETWGWLAKHPRAQRALARLTAATTSEFLSYGWLFVARKRS